MDQLPLYFSIGVSNGLLPLLAYNHTAGNQKRREQSLQFGAVISVGFALLCVLCYEIFADSLTALFIQDQVTIAYGAVFLRCICGNAHDGPLLSHDYPIPGHGAG